MQNPTLRKTILSCLLLVLWMVPAHAANPTLKEMRQLANLAYRTSQDMVVHGAEGHVEEIVAYGKKMIARTETLLKQVEASGTGQLGKQKGKLIATIKAALKKAREAVALGRKNKVKAALAAARKASFQAKRTRQRLQMIR